MSALTVVRRRRLISAMAVAPLVLPSASRAQAYPAKPIRIIVPTPAGSGPDVDVRHIASRASALLGQPIVVDNRPGAGTRIAIEAAARSAPDGYTFLLGTPSLTTAPSLYSKLPFDAERDLTPVSLLSSTAYALTVNAAVPAPSLATYIAAVRSDGAHGNIGTFGVGTIPHLAGAWFASLTGAQFKFVHYNTTPPFPDLLAGQVSAMFEAMLPMTPHVKSGRLRMLAISGSTRQPLLPDVPTFAEAGVAAFSPLVWVGILAPAGTPAPIVERVSAVLAQVARMPEVISYRRDAGSDSIGSSPAEFASFLENERRKWGSVIRAIGLKLE